MSEWFLHIVPSNPEYIPSESQIGSAVSVLTSAWSDVNPKVVMGEDKNLLDRGDEIVLHVVLRKDVEFVGGPFETLFCPYCQRTLDFNWWGAAMDKAFESKFRDLSVKTPCCARQTSLNDLDYGGAVGFSRFSIDIMNPFREVGRRAGPEPGPGYWVRLEPLPLGPDVLSRIGVVLGCPARAILYRL